MAVYQACHAVVTHHCESAGTTYRMLRPGSIILCAGETIKDPEKGRHTMEENGRMSGTEPGEGRDVRLVALPAGLVDDAEREAAALGLTLGDLVSRIVGGWLVGDPSPLDMAAATGLGGLTLLDVFALCGELGIDPVAFTAAVGRSGILRGKARGWE